MNIHTRLKLPVLLIIIFMNCDGQWVLGNEGVSACIVYEYSRIYTRGTLSLYETDCLYETFKSISEVLSVPLRYVTFAIAVIAGNATRTSGCFLHWFFNKIHNFSRERHSSSGNYDVMRCLIIRKRQSFDIRRDTLPDVSLLAENKTGRHQRNDVDGWSNLFTPITRGTSKYVYNRCICLKWIYRSQSRLLLKLLSSYPEQNH